jgi:hypothetical protein
MSAANTDSQQTTPSISLKGGWLILARFVWMLVAINSVAALGLFIPFAYEHLKRIGDWRRAALFMIGVVNDTFYARYYVTLMVIFAVIYMGVALFLFWRKYDDRIVFLTSLMLVSFGVAGAAALHPTLASEALRETTPLSTLMTISLIVGSMLFFTVFFIFPDGRFIPRWTRWVELAVFIYIGSLILPENFPLRINNLSPSLFMILPFVFFGFAIYAQIYRYMRVSTVPQRQQTKGFVYGVGISVTLILIFVYLLPRLVPVLAPPTVPAAALGYEMFSSLIIFTLIVIPLSIAASILRHQLWDIYVFQRGNQAND